MPEIEFSERNKFMKEVGKALRMMSGMCLSCVFALFFGKWLDEVCNTSPILLLLCLTYAIVMSLYKLVKGFGDENG